MDQHFVSQLSIMMKQHFASKLPNHYHLFFQISTAKITIIHFLEPPEYNLGSLGNTTSFPIVKSH
jgi:hypothetical protein